MKEELIIKRIAYAYDLFSLLYKKDKKSKFIYCDIIHIHFLYSFIFLIRKQEKKIFFSFLVFLPFLGFSIPLTDAVLIEFFFDEKKNSVEKLYKYINIITSFNLKSQEDLKSLRLNKIFSFLHRIVFFINKSQDKNIETDDVYGNSLQEKINKIIKHKKVEDYSDIIIQKKILKEIISKIDVYISPRLHTKFVIFSSVFFVLLFFINKILFFIFFTPMFLFFFQKLFSYIFKYIIYYLALLFLNLKGLFFLKK